MRATAAEKQKKVANAEYVDNSLSFQYDGLNRLTQEDAVDPTSRSEENPSGYGYTADYTYDLAGNRTLRHVRATREYNQQPVTEHLWTQYQYDMDNDRLELETHSSTQPVGMLPWGGDRAYAYASPTGSLSYGLPGSDRRIGSFGAFWQGLPSVWNRYAMILLAAMLPLAAFGPMLAQQWRQIRGAVTASPRPTLSLYHRCLCVLFAYIFLVGPENFQSLASAEIQYTQLSLATWGQSGDTFTYGYDANGSLESKTTARGGQTVEEIEYVYDLRGQLKQVTTTPVPGTAVVTQYKYNPQGIRTEKIESGVSTKYLIDPYNPTGYAQVLEEWTGGTTPAVTYTIGDDIIGQSVGSTVSYLLYDGHGSTRQLSSASAGISDNFSYDAYGMMLGDSTNPNPAQTAATKYLYAGEQYDKSLSHYYLRARYYNPSNGRFNQTDPFAGNPSDPQSLQKYLYAHCNPVNNIDPSGMFTISETMLVNAIRNIFTEVMASFGNAALFAGECTTKGYSLNQTIFSYFLNIAVGVVIVAAVVLTTKVVVSFLSRSLTPAIDLAEAGQKAIVYGELDDLGRPSGVTAILKPGELSGGTKANPRIRPPGFGGQVMSHDRGHLLARQLGGSGDDARNLVAMYSDVNQGVMKSLEYEVRDAVEAGETIIYNVIPEYRGKELIPAGVTIIASGDGGYRKLLSIINSPQL